MNVASTKEYFERKFETLKKQEQNLVHNQVSPENSKFKIERKLFSCNDGFIILRRYTKENIEDFLLISVNESVEVFLRNLPYVTRTDQNIKINLFELLKSTIGIELKIGQTINIGSEGGGINVGDKFIIDGFVILTRRYSEVLNIEETLTDIYKFLEIVGENQKLSKEIEDKEFLVDYANIELQEAKIDLEKEKNNFEALIKSIPESKSVNPKKELSIPKPFNICVLGEVSDQGVIRFELNKFFGKLGVNIKEWDIEFNNNTKLQNTDILRSLIKGQTKFNLILTGQIFHHSGKGNNKANIISELKNKKYIPHKIAVDPKDKLTPDKTLISIEEFLKEISGEYYEYE